MKIHLTTFGLGNVFLNIIVGLMLLGFLLGFIPAQAGSLPTALTAIATFALTFGRQLCISTGACTNFGINFNNENARAWAESAGKAFEDPRKMYGGYGDKKNGTDKNSDL